MYSIEIHRRPSLRGEFYAGSLFVRVIYGRKCRSITLPWRLYASEWDERRRSVVLEASGSWTTRSARERRAVLARIAEELEEVKLSLRTIAEELQSSGRLSAGELVLRFRRRRESSFIGVFVDRLCLRMHALGQERMVRAYRSVFSRLCRFYEGKDIPFSAITPLFLSRWQETLLAEGLCENTVSFYMRNLRSICRKAHREGVLPGLDPGLFLDVFTGMRLTRKRSLSVEEIRRLDSLDLCAVSLKEKERTVIHRTRQLFLFSFFARGMSFVDMAYLKKEDIRDGRILYYRRKTGAFLNIRITPPMEQIIRFFGEETRNSPYIFPLIRDMQRSARSQYETALRLQNKRLKRLASICFGPLSNSPLQAIDYPLSTHVARHTWATLARFQDIPLGVISAGLGHSSEKTTAIYLASFGERVVDQAGDKIVDIVKKVG